MGFLQRLFGKKDRGPTEALLARFPDHVIAAERSDPELARMFPAIPQQDLTVLVAFMRIGASETGTSFDVAQTKRALELICHDYQRGGLEVRRAENEWEVWQTERSAIRR